MEWGHEGKGRQVEQLQPPSPLLDAAIIEPLGRYITSASQIVQLLTMS